jgi:hypothetical protein
VNVLLRNVSSATPINRVSPKRASRRCMDVFTQLTGTGPGRLQGCSRDCCGWNKDGSGWIHLSKAKHSSILSGLGAGRYHAPAESAHRTCTRDREHRPLKGGRLKCHVRHRCIPSVPIEKIERQQRLRRNRPENRPWLGVFR